MTHYMLRLIFIASFIIWKCESAETQFVIVTINQTSEAAAPKFGFNLEAGQATSNGNNPVLYNWLNNYFFLKLLRFPGGTISSYWSWENGAVNETLCKQGIAPDQYCHLTEAYTLKYFQSVLNQFTEAIPMWDLNCITATLPSQISLLTSAKNLGMDISHIELGNEYYTGTDLGVYQNGSVYAETMNAWVDKMKDSFSSSSFALIGSSINDTLTATRWNSQVVKNTDGNANAFTLHWYLTNLPGCSDVCNKVSNEMLPSWFNHTANAWDVLVQNAIQVWPAKYKIWVTEYNVLDYNSGQTGVVLGSWVHALLFAQQTFSLLSSPTPVSVIMAQALGDRIWKSYANTSTATYEATPFGVVAAAFMKCGMTASSVYQLSFDPQINISSNFITNALVGYLFKSTGPEGICAVAINLSNTTASFYVPRILPQPIEYVPCTTYTMNPSDYFKQNVTEKDLVTANCDAYVFAPQGITIPPYSFLYLSALVE